MKTLFTTATYDAKRKILIPQKFPPYQPFTVRVVFVPKEDVSQDLEGNLKQALREAKNGKLVGPFETISELKKSLEV